MQADGTEVIWVCSDYSADHRSKPLNQVCVFLLYYTSAAMPNCMVLRFSCVHRLLPCETSGARAGEVLAALCV